MNGVINVLKPPGMTSHDVVAFLRREFKMKRIGHAGTLDPEAAGVLPVCIGQATRLVDYLTIRDKEYFCTMKIGCSTTTQDAWGEVIKENQAKAACVTVEQVKQVIARFVGEIQQVTPMYSAVKVKGQPLYKMARSGKQIDTPVRNVTINDIKITELQLPAVSMLVNCSKGTYIRTLCHDIGETLGVGGYLSFLLRTKVGKFSLADCHTLENIRKYKEKLVLPMSYCVQELISIKLSDKNITAVKQGKMIDVKQDEACFMKEGSEYPITQVLQVQAPVAVYDVRGIFHALTTVRAKNEVIQIKPKKVFHME